MKAASVGSRAIRPCTARLVVVALLAVLFCGCSSFNRAWNQAARTPVPPGSIEGRWEGRWLSAANGHDGRLRCLITKDSEETYQARFRATYKKLLHFGYTVPLQVTRSNGVWSFRGEADLGSMAGGVYHYEGSATPEHFHSTYDSKYDRGDFEMKRPAAE